MMINRVSRNLEVLVDVGRLLLYEYRCLLDVHNFAVLIESHTSGLDGTLALNRFSFSRDHHPWLRSGARI